MVTLKRGLFGVLAVRLIWLASQLAAAKSDMLEGRDQMVGLKRFTVDLVKLLLHL